MSPRQQYEAHRLIALEAAVEIRQRLYETYMGYAQEAEKRHDWAACTAFQTAAGLALSTAVTLSQPQTASTEAQCPA